MIQKYFRLIALIIYITLTCFKFASGSDITDSSKRPATLEELAFKYGTDKSKDDHNYVDLYASLFMNRKRKIHNMTEVYFVFDCHSLVFMYICI